MESPPPLTSATPATLRAPVAWWAFPWWLRLVLVLAGGFLLSLLIVARWLEPSPRGLGTHQQLGLPPCRFQEMFGRRCPACGMTTSWSHLTRGQVVAALTVNTGGTLLAILAMITGPWLLLSGLRGRWWGEPPHEFVVVILCVVVTLVILVDWMTRLYFA